MPLAPHSKATNIDKRDITLAIVAASKSAGEIAKLLKEHRIVVYGIPDFGIAFFPVVAPGRHFELYALCSSFFNPLRRGIGPARLAAGNAKSDLLACSNPRLGVGVENIPAELTLIRLDLTPRNAHINDARAREPIERITGIGTRTITP